VVKVKTVKKLFSFSVLTTFKHIYRHIQNSIIKKRVLIFFIILHKTLQSAIINNLGLYLCRIIQQANWVWKLILLLHSYVSSTLMPLRRPHELFSIFVKTEIKFVFY